jgi:hypothetical protein
MNRKFIAGACGLGLISAVLVAASPAVAGTTPPSGAEAPGLPTVAISQPAPENTTIVTVADLPSVRALDIDTTLAVSEIVQTDSDRSINTVNWDNDRDVVQFYVHGDASEVTSTIAAEFPHGQAWEVVPSVRPIAELEATIERLAVTPGELPAGMTFVSGTPAPDGTFITVGVEGSPTSRLGAQSIPDKLLGVPVSFVTEERAQTTSRVRTDAPIVAGGYMSGPSSAGNMACSTGYPVTRYQDSQYNMITADHCTDQQGVSWKWGGGSHSVGNSTFQASGGTDLELFVEPASLSTWIFVGNHQDVSSVLPIRGYVSPVGGNSVCYSGSRSGLVCSNTVNSSDSYNCVGFLQCYWTRWTTQVNGTPAAGNGDSGGPVFVPLIRPDDNTIGAYGVGIVSMIPDPSPATCTGDPGSTATNGRKCSATVGFAPLNRWASAQSTHRLVITTQ